MRKYRNKPQEWQGQKFRSKRELARYQELLLLERAGKIGSLQREVTFVLAPAVKLDGKTKRCLRYIADFVYVRAPMSTHTVEDCKGVRTDAYRIKRHLMRHLHGIEVLET